MIEAPQLRPNGTRLKAVTCLWRIFHPAPFGLRPGELDEELRRLPEDLVGQYPAAALDTVVSYLLEPRTIVGLELGDVELALGRIFGEGVNVARVQPQHFAVRHTDEPCPPPHVIGISLPVCRPGRRTLSIDAQFKD